MKTGNRTIECDGALKTLKEHTNQKMSAGARTMRHTSLIGQSKSERAVT
jgi:hypothetical protein